MAVAKRETAQARIADLSFDRTGWLGAARAEALARLIAMGLPGKRDEYWRYSDPVLLNAPEAGSAALFDAGDEPMTFEIGRASGRERG